MSADDAEAQDRSNSSASDIDALINEVQLLQNMRASLKADAADQTMVEAVTGLLRERQADLERSVTEQPSE